MKIQKPKKTSAVATLTTAAVGTTRSDAKSDQRLLDAARAAQRECSGFTNTARDARNIGAVLEMLRHMVCDGACKVVDADWARIAYLLDDCAERSNGVVMALDTLARCEEPEAANG